MEKKKFDRRKEGGKRFPLLSFNRGSDFLWEELIWQHLTHNKRLPHARLKNLRAQISHAQWKDGMDDSELQDLHGQVSAEVDEHCPCQKAPYQKMNTVVSCYEERVGEEVLLWRTLLLYFPRMMPCKTTLFKKCSKLACWDTLFFLYWHAQDITSFYVFIF